MIYCVLPNAGLGNQLFVIAKSLVFKELNGGLIIYVNTTQFKIGPYLRGDRSKRNYLNFFIFQKNLILDLIRSFYFKHIIKNIEFNEPSLAVMLNFKSVVFSQIPHYSIYFKELIPYRELIKERLFDILNDNIKNIILKLDVIDVAVHIRLGDFQRLGEGVDFKTVGGTRTPLIYFIEEITRLKELNGDYRFFIFSDGKESELKAVLDLDNTFFYKSENDIVDLYQMSKSKFLITSAGSTYSYWAGFLGDCKIIQHPSHTTSIINIEKV
jgi:hypothetical protein